MVGYLGRGQERASDSSIQGATQVYPNPVPPGIASAKGSQRLFACRQKQPPQRPSSSVLVAWFRTVVSASNCSFATSTSPRSIASFTPGITTAAYPVYCPGA